MYHYGVFGSWASLLVNNIIYNVIIIIITILEFVHQFGVTGGQSPLLIWRLLIGVSYHRGKGLVVLSSTPPPMGEV